MIIRQQNESDLEDVLKIQALAFGYDKEADLVRAMLLDPSAKPDLSLLALGDDGALMGHILFTHVTIPDQKLQAAILAPLAVIPAYQNKGVGGELIKEGLAILEKAGVELVFVLGHPGYYPKYGFEPAGVRGYNAPYPIPEEHAAAWMMQDLLGGQAKGTGAKITCCDALMQPEHWRE